MNKTAIKNFAIWARNKLIADINYKAGLLGITEKESKSPLPQSTQTVQFFDIGTKEPSSISGIAIDQRKKLVEEILRKAKQSDHATAYKNVIEEVAYTWFNRLIAIRFMEVNDYLPTRIRVLSSESNGKAEPDLVTHAQEVNLDYSAYEKDRIIQLKHENKLDELFRMLFIKQCNALNSNLPELFEKTSDYTELLLNVSFTDKEGVIYHLVNDIDEDDFNVSKEGQVEIIGWLYQYYNTEPKDETFALLKKNVKITKERIPAATQLFTPDWIVRYMVENSLGRLWLEGHPNEELKSNWKYYLDEAEQEEDVRKQLNKIREEYKGIKPEDIKVIDPAMGSGHILVYAFDVLMQIYESFGYNQSDAAKSIIENNLYGLDIDNRAYQLTYFAVMMKARQFSRRILNDETICHIYAIQESNPIDRNHLQYFGSGLSAMEKNSALLQIQGLIDCYKDAKEYGSIISVENYNWDLLHKFINGVDMDGQLSLDSIGFEIARDLLELLINLGETMARKYDVVVTNPPYMGNGGMGAKLAGYVKRVYPNSKRDLFAVFIERCLEFSRAGGYQTMITQHAWMFLNSYEELRIKILENTGVINMAHLGARAFDEIGGEVVQTVAFVLCKAPIRVGRYIRLINFANQEEKKIRFLNSVSKLPNDLHFIASQDDFALVPRNPIAYWLKHSVIEEFSKNPSIGDKYFSCYGLLTGHDEGYIFNWHEVSYNDIAFSMESLEQFNRSGKKFVPISKGGEYRRWYGNNDLVVRYDEQGVLGMSKYPKYASNGKDRYFQEGITWAEVCMGRLSLRYMPKGNIFTLKGPAMFHTESTKLMQVLGFLNTKVADFLIQALNPTISCGTGVLSRLPTKGLENVDPTIIEQNIAIAKQEWDSFETSWEFKRHPLIGNFYQEKCTENLISKKFSIWAEYSLNQFNLLRENEERINDCFISLYDLNTELFPETNETDITIQKAAYIRDIRSLVSYAIGCILGRYSADNDGVMYAGGEWDINNYRSYLPDKDNILPITDEEYFQDDIVSRLIEFIKGVYGSKTLEDNLNFISNALGGKGKSSREVIRDYFVKDFFKDHCQMYQKRPIYWLFDSGKQNGFKALIYIHRYDKNTIGNLRIDYLHKVQRIYENEISRMQDTIDNSRDAREVTAATKRKEKMIKQLQETKEYDEKIAHLALARISIDLDDGVKVNYEKVQTDRDGKKLDVLAKI